MDSFNKARLKSIIEYNLRKFRINSMEYKSGQTTKSKDGVSGLLNDDRLFKSWNQRPIRHRTGINSIAYSILETNIQLRDFLAQTIYDIFCGSDSDGDYSKSNERIYNIIPSKGSSKPEKEEDSPFIIKRGDNEFKVTKEGIFINGKKYGD